MDKTIIAPSTLPCPLSEMNDYLKVLSDGGAEWLHCDIMDGKFVPNKTFDDITLSLITKKTNMFIDVHLMVQNPQDLIQRYIRAGAQGISIHYEAIDSRIELMQLLKSMKSMGLSVGLAIKPNTPVSRVQSLFPLIDTLLIMSVEPGAGGQPFILDTLPKIMEAKRLREEKGSNFLIEVDGGVNETNARSIIGAGADVLVCGSAMYKAQDKKAYVKLLKGINAQ